MPPTLPLPAWAQGYAFDTWTAHDPLPYIGTCRACKTTRRVMITQLKQLQSGTTIKAIYRYEMPSGCTMTRHQGKVTFLLDCATCQTGRITLRKVEGFASEHTKCDSRCTSAKGHSCECSCAGANHGSAHTG